MKYYVVFDTNVLISSLLTKKPGTATGRIVDMITEGIITPVFNQEILDEYRDVLHRKKFSFSDQAIDNLLRMMIQFGQSIEALETEEPFLRDSDDKVFFEVVMAKRGQTDSQKDAYLISGNLKHYPLRPFIVTPAEMLAIILQ